MKCIFFQYLTPWCYAGGGLEGRREGVRELEACEVGLEELEGFLEGLLDGVGEAVGQIVSHQSVMGQNP